MTDSEHKGLSTGAEKVEWNLSDLYNSAEDPRIEKDMDICRKQAERIAEKYSDHVAELDAAGLFSAVKEIEDMYETVGRLSAFAYLNFATAVNDPETGAFLQKIREFSSEISRKIVFFELEWAALPEEHANAVLALPEISHYRHYLEAARRYRPHLLSRAEEELLADLSPVRRSSWNSLFEKVLAKEKFGPKQRTMEEVLSDLYSPDRNIRKEAAQEMTGGLEKNLHVLTHTFNTVLADKMIEDRLRKYPSWISSMNLANELDDQTVEALVEAVTSQNSTVARFYHLKKEMLGVDRLFDYDRYAPLPFMPDDTVSWDECRQTVLDAYRKFSPSMAETASLFFDRNWIDAGVKPGKTSGAFAHPVVPSVHPYVLINYTGNLRDVETVAHELGHGVHQVLASDKGYFNSDTPLTLAETASVFGEMLVFQDLLQKLDSDRKRLGLAAAKVESIFATVFRQIAMNRFEHAIHTFRREKGELSQEKFRELWLETQSAMFGDSVVLTDDYGIWWSYISHFIHVPGYVYAYAFGELLVLSLYSMYSETRGDEREKFVKKYLSLLSAGGSDTPYRLLEPFGIDLHDPEFWNQGLKMIDHMVDQVEELAGRVL